MVLYEHWNGIRYSGLRLREPVRRRWKLQESQPLRRGAVFPHDVICHKRWNLWRRLGPIPAEVHGGKRDHLPLRPQLHKGNLCRIPFAFTLFAFNFLLRAIGDTRTPVKINIATVLLNLVLDPLFIFGVGPFPRLGVVGAAVATMLFNSLGSIVGGYLLFTGRVGVHLTLANLRPDRHFYSRIFRVSLSSSVETSTTALGFVILTRIIFTIGKLYGQAHGIPNFEDVAFATYSITNRLTNFMFAFSDGISMAMRTMVGQAVGARLYDRAKEIVEKAMVITFTILGVGMLLFALFRVQIFSFFINDPAIIAESAKVVKYFSASLPFFGIFSAVNNVF